MISRLACRLRPASTLNALAKPRIVVLSIPRASASTDVAQKKEETTDVVKFARPVRLVNPGKVRLGFIPEEWFQFFYEKTGVTGPYLFGIGFISFLLSKEIYVLEHEFYTGISIAIMIIYAVKKWGPATAKYLDKEIEKVEDNYKAFRNTAIDGLKQNIKGEETAQWQADGEKYLFEAKRENVALQLEAAYRERLFTAYQEVKNRLDYQLDVQNTTLRMQQRHMVNWIINNVLSSITAQQEKDAIKNSIEQLKKLSATAKVSTA